MGERVRGRVRARLGGWVGSVEWMGGRMVGETVDGWVGGRLAGGRVGGRMHECVGG